MITRLITLTLFAIWLVLILLGKGGMVHLLLISAICVGAVDMVGTYRSKLTISDADKP
ncbi:MAG: hypothetical protein JO314_00930 [Acidobacteria bacterium]|nr:hypothetical protein [Acidobacteriota bacterium]